MKENDILIYFPHIPKAGGTTLKNMFYEVFGKDNCLKVWDGPTSDVSPHEFKEFRIGHQTDFKVILGHLPVADFLENPYFLRKYELGEVRIVSSVREPIERLLSQYNYVRLNEEHPNFERVREMSVEDYLLSMESNYQVKFLSYNKSPKNLQVYPLSKAIDGFSREIFQLSGQTPQQVKIANRTSSINESEVLMNSSMLSDGLIKTLMEKHSEDYLLFNSLRR